MILFALTKICDRTLVVEFVWDLPGAELGAENLGMPHQL